MVDMLIQRRKAEYYEFIVESAGKSTELQVDLSGKILAPEKK
jgi:hypothetical protein